MGDSSLSDLSLHRRLERQLKDSLGKTTDFDGPVQALVDQVNAVYKQADEDRAMLERSLKSSSQDLMQANHEMRAILKAIPDLVLTLDEDHLVTHYKRGIGTFPFIIEDHPQGKPFHRIVKSTSRERFEEFLEQVERTGHPNEFEFIDYGSSNDHYFEARVIPVEAKRTMVLVRDISHRKEFEERIARIAYQDSLTGLPNRLLFNDRLRQCASMARRARHMVGVMFIDIDRFKQINDTLGHSVGDQLLVVVTERLVECLRDSDTVAKVDHENPLSTVARLGGDEFTIILSQIDSVSDVTRIATRILRQVSQPIAIAGEEVRITVSIGIALYPIDGEDIDTLVGNADAALYHAKARGKNNYQLYTESINRVNRDRLALENQLRKAIEKNELQLYYQPQMSLQDGRIIGVEALIRWIHPERGFISPGMFVPLAEESELILDLGAFVFREACTQALEWYEMGFDWLKTSVNVSGKQFKEGHLIHSLEKVLKEVPLPYECLGIEITETAIMDNPELSADMLKIIRNMEVDISLDDFGTGYSSLNYLKQFPISTLKIDQSFIRDVTTKPEDAALTEAIISMSHALGMQVVAEGVETAEHLEFLRKLKCDNIQGYYLCRPLPVDKVTDYLMAHEGHRRNLSNPSS